MEKILLPTDFSEASNIAIPKVIHFAELIGESEVHIYLLNIVNEPNVELYDGIPIPPPSEWLDQAKEAARSKLSEIRNGPLRDLSVTICVESTPQSTHAKIVKVAEENDVNMIVMGTHGRSGLERFFLGSVAEKVIRHSHCPVLLVPPRS